MITTNADGRRLNRPAAFLRVRRELFESRNGVYTWHPVKSSAFCRKYLFRIAFSLSLISFTFPAWSQSDINIHSLINNFSVKQQSMPVEKLYLQLDKTDYLQNDTLWFKAYLLDADFLKPSRRSGLLYVEIDDGNNKSVKRLLFPLGLGLGWGNITLDEDAVPEGDYTVRAYTNWMRNFGEEYVYKKMIHVASPEAKERLIATDFKTARQGEQENITANLLVSNLDKSPVRLQDMALRVTDGKHNFLKSDVTTGVDGKIAVNFNLPEKTIAKNLYIDLHDITKGDADTKIYLVPVPVERPENTDLQFMPEGGTLLEGVASRIGLKAIGEGGKGTDVSGSILDNRQQNVASFKSSYKGMGSFVFTPQSGESYSVVLNLPDGTIKHYPFPAVSMSGATISIDNTLADSLKLTMSVTPDLLRGDLPIDYYIIGQSRGVICYAAQITVEDPQIVRSISKKLFPSGITRFTLLTAKNLPVAERIIYIDHHDNLRLDITPDPKDPTAHDSVALHLHVADKNGKPFCGSFSMAITDDSLVKADNKGSNIVNYMLLTADLKGIVEDPAYYFMNDSQERQIELDNLLLTQGWVGYDWAMAMAPGSDPKFAAQPEFTVEGKVSNAFNKPIAGSRVTLLSKRPVFVANAETGKDGRFVFRGFLPVDSASFFIQARNKNNGTFNIGLDVDEFKPPVFTEMMPKLRPWYVNSDSLLLRKLNAAALLREQQEKFQGRGRILNEVKIVAKKVVNGSKNLNGPGEADDVFNEQDMLKAGKMTLEEYLMAKVKGFKTGYVGRSPNLVYMIKDEAVRFVIDGKFTDRFYTPDGDPDGLFQYNKQYLDYFTAEDLKGIEVMYNSNYTSEYSAEYSMSSKSLRSTSGTLAFIEITTRSGIGPFINSTPGTYLYRPLPVTAPAKFYRPKYTIKSQAGPDLRSTIHWEPGIVTDTTGKATVSFFSGGKHGTYTIRVEGADLNGSVGFTQDKLLIH